jgi:UDP-glucose 4-epimerase
MRILITGAGGFLGRHLLAHFTGKHELYGLVRRKPEHPVPHVNYVVQDLSHPLDRTQLPEQVDAVVHMAAVLDADKTLDTTLFTVNVLATWRLLTYAAEVGASAFLFASSGSVYGTGSQAFAEHQIVDPGELVGLTKAQAELAVETAPGDFHRIILRYFSVYGPGAENAIFQCVQKATQGQPIDVLTSGRPRFNPLYIDDAVEATARGLELGQSVIMNIAGPEIATYSGIAAYAARLVGRVPTLRYVDEAPLPLCERSDLIADISRMRHMLGFMPGVTLAQGVAELVRSLQADPPLPASAAGATAPITANSETPTTGAKKKAS